MTTHHLSVSERDIVNEVIAAHPATIAVFNEHGIDACCGGAASIRDAAARDGVALHELLDALARTVHAGRDA